MRLLSGISKLLLTVVLATVLGCASAHATVSTTQNQTVLGGNSATTVWPFNFIAVSASDLEVIYTNSSGVPTTISPTQYTVNLNAVSPGALWSTGGNVTYPLTGSPIASGTTLTIQRILPLTQTTSLTNQGDYSPTITEQALDTGVMQSQQVSARTGQMRGTWVTAQTYNFGDVVQDGANGNNTGSYFMCADANTSGTWATDLANGDWSLVIQSALPAASLPLSIGNGGTGQPTASAALAALGGVSLSGTNTYTGSNSFTGASITVPTRSPGDNSTNAASTAFVTANSISSTSPNFLISASLNSHPLVTTVNVQRFFYTGSTQTYTPTTGTVYAIVEVVGGGGGGGGVGTASGALAAGGGGSGAYSRGIFSASAIGSSQTVTIGIGGSAGANTGGNGGNGGTSSFGSLIASVSGGTGGGGTNTDASAGAGASGGSAGSGGFVNISGGPGSDGYPGASQRVLGGRGADSPGGLGQGGKSIYVAAAHNAGGGATGYGGAGAGAVAGDGGTGAIGGTGAPGIEIVTEFISN